MKELLNALMLRAADDCLGSMGLIRSRSVSQIGPALMCFGAGAIVGACAALLLTPYTGEELIAKVQENVRSARQRVRPEDSRPRRTQRAEHAGH